MQPTNPIPEYYYNRGGYGASVISAFKGALMHLFGLSFAINLLTACVPIFLMFFFDGKIAFGDRSFSTWGMAAIALVLGLNFVVRYARSGIISQMLYKIDAKVSGGILERVFKIPVRDKKMESFWRSVFTDIDIIRGGLTTGHISNFLDAPFTLLFMATLCVLFGRHFFIILVFTCIYAAFILATMHSASMMDDREKLATKERDELVSNTVYNMGEIKTMLITEKIQKMWEDYQAAIVEATYKRSYSLDLFSVLGQAIYLLGLVILSVVGVYSISRGAMSVGSTIAAVLLFSYNFFLTSNFLRFLPEYFRFINSIERLGQAIADQETQSKTERIEDITDGEIKLEKATVTGEKDEVILNRQTFAFKDGRPYVIRANNTFEGSLLLRALMGGYGADDGRILFDRYDVSTLQPKSIKDYIRYVPEGYFAIDGTIKENLNCLTSESADAKKYAGFIGYRDAADMLGLESAIRALPNGYNTIIDSKTRLMSEENLKLLSLARAFVGNPRVMLFDKPLSGLSSTSRDKFMDAIASVAADRIAIASETAPWHADRIEILLNDGIITASEKNREEEHAEDGQNRASFRRVFRKK
ncbi:MAG: ATP-binding cassette domain-containing protein [Rickettsiales bacterium]|jgi:ATP-binding cassette subfamily C protein LapB|nr:ATP-binding cassette domain-containing protein [Rickettsiales bacterium]